MIILASNSPRRKEILTEFGYKFEVVKSEFGETACDTDSVATAVSFAKGKATDVFLRLKAQGRSGNPIVIGADTVVCFDGRIIGKPKNAADAENTLKILSGKEHTVITGYAVLGDKIRVFGFDKSTVIFNELPEKLIKEYVATGKPLDKAGSYGVQDGFGLVKAVSGSVYNVIGFPIERIKPILDAAGEYTQANINR
ncbi:MAG: septum formation protein Maf [Clostridia bacterium]|nr:septum formation protein Maf [Clostridia bacterium]